jgi:polyferredoxin
VQLSNGNIRNGYDLKILNKTHEEQTYQLLVTGLAQSQISIIGAGETEISDISVPSDSVGQYKTMVSAPLQSQEPITIEFIIKNINTGTTASYETMFISKKPHM